MFMPKPSRVSTGIALLSLISLLTLTSCLNDDNTSQTNPVLGLIEEADTYDDLSTFSEYADTLNLESLLAESGTYSVFAPINEAFTDFSESILDTLSTEQLEEVFSYHIADTALFTNQLNPNQQIASLTGEDLFISLGTQNIFLNNGILVAGNIQATNGVLHATNVVLFPDSYLDVVQIINKRYDLTTMSTAIEETELHVTLTEDTENLYTVLAPTNTAFDNVSSPQNEEELQNLLEYHIIPQTLQADDFESSQNLQTMSGEEITVEVEGDTITLNGSATVSTVDLEGTNGVVHVIDEVLTLPENN